MNGFYTVTNLLTFINSLCSLTVNIVYTNLINFDWKIVKKHHEVLSVMNSEIKFKEVKSTQVLQYGCKLIKVKWGGSWVKQFLPLLVVFEQAMSILACFYIL